MFGNPHSILLGRALREQLPRISEKNCNIDKVGLILLSDDFIVLITRKWRYLIYMFLAGKAERERNAPILLVTFLNA